MSPLDFMAILLLVSVVAGALGSLVGLGGGVVIVPVLTLVFHVGIRLAIGASIVAVIATSSGAAAAYVRDRLANIRVGMFLETATTLGAISGALVTAFVPVRALFVLFAAVLGYSAVETFRKRNRSVRPVPGPDRTADFFGLHGSFFDPARGEQVPYRVSRSHVGLGAMYVAGTVSALLGIGSGALKVPAMDLAMGMPMKASSATSNFMIGVTAAASAGVYFARGQIDPVLAAPVAIGVLAGALAGSRLLGRLQGRSLRLLFVAVLGVIAIQMLVKGIA